MSRALSALVLAVCLLEGCATATHGAISKASIRGTVRAHMGEVTHCYRLAREERPALNAGGRLKVRFVIGEDGAVLSANTLESPRGDRPLAACVETAVRGWHFAEPEGHGIVVVEYPFTLHPAAVASSR